jgi:hypothetical protein
MTVSWPGFTATPAVASGTRLRATFGLPMETPVRELGKRLVYAACYGRSATLEPELDPGRRRCLDGITEVDGRSIGRHGGRVRAQRAFAGPRSIGCNYN